MLQNVKPPFSRVLISVSSFVTCISCRMRGLLVTMPVPRGRKSRPTRLSSTELFPALCKLKTFKLWLALNNFSILMYVLQYLHPNNVII